VARCSKLLLTHEKKLLEIEQARCQQRDVFQNLLDSTLNHQEQMESKARRCQKLEKGQSAKISGADAAKEAAAHQCICQSAVSIAFMHCEHL